MPLTAVIGSSGSGKTTFLNDVHKRHKGTYIRQYHTMRPYIVVSRIPNFDPTKLPYWDIYEREEKASSIQAGGTMGGEFTAGLSGGQRKLLLFELICQRIQNQPNGLLIILDEPFAGVTDDFVPFVIDRLEIMRAKHNVLLVTNDHVAAITKMADNTITVSAVDRSIVTVNKRSKKREKTIEALSIGDRYIYESSSSDLKFFLDTEISMNRSLIYLSVFALIAYSMYLMSLWNSAAKSFGLVVIGAEMVVYCTFNPYLMSLIEWRTAMYEESEALIHSSKGMNKFMKLIMTLVLILIATYAEYGIINAVIDGFEDIKFLLALICDNFYVLSPFIVLGIFSRLSLEAVGNIAGVQYLALVFFSTTFSPGSGVPGVKALRYLFPRFYFWCMLPEIGDKMEGCPSDDYILLYMLASFSLLLIGFGCIRTVSVVQKMRSKQAKHAKRLTMVDQSFLSLEGELKGTKFRTTLEPLNETENETSHGKLNEDEEEECIDFFHSGDLEEETSSSDSNNDDGGDVIEDLDTSNVQLNCLQPSSKSLMNDIPKNEGEGVTAVGSEKV